jgi:catalase
VLKASGIRNDAGVPDATDSTGLIKAAKTRQWNREPRVRLLA